VRTGFFVLTALALLASQAQGQDFTYHQQGFSISATNDNTPYLYDSNGLLAASIGRGADDQFTAGFRLESVGSFASPWSDTLIASANYAMYTDTQYYAIWTNGVPDHPPWRLDTGSAQLLFEKAGTPWTVDYGTGLVFKGNLGGQAVQDLFHGAIHDVQYDLTYPTRFEAGPFLTATLTYSLFALPWNGWEWSGAASGRGFWDVLGILNNQADALVRFDVDNHGMRLELAAGGRASLPGPARSLSSMYSSGLFLDSTFEIRFGDFTMELGYAINPYGAAPISAYPAYNDLNQEFHWTLVWGRENPVPWALRFYP